MIKSVKFDKVYPSLQGLTTPAGSPAYTPSPGSPPRVAASNATWLRYDPMNVNAPGQDVSPYSEAAIGDVANEVQSKGLIVMFSALNQTANAGVTSRNV